MQAARQKDKSLFALKLRLCEICIRNCGEGSMPGNVARTARFAEGGAAIRWRSRAAPDAIAFSWLERRQGAFGMRIHLPV